MSVARSRVGEERVCESNQTRASHGNGEIETYLFRSGGSVLLLHHLTTTDDYDYDYEYDYDCDYDYAYDCDSDYDYDYDYYSY